MVVNRGQDAMLTVLHCNQPYQTMREFMMEMSDHPVTKQYFDFADRMPYGGYGDGFGGGAWWIFAILVLFLWGGNGFGNRNGVGPVAADLGVTTAENAAETRAGLNYIGQSQAAQNNTLGQIKDNMSAGFAGVQQSLCQGFSGINTNLQNGFYGLNTSILNSKFELAQAIDRCCCNTQQGIAALGAAMDRNTCAIISFGKDNTQAILNALCSHWQEQATRKITNLECEVREQRILSAIAAKNA